MQPDYAQDLDPGQEVVDTKDLLDHRDPGVTLETKDRVDPLDLPEPGDPKDPLRIITRIQIQSPVEKPSSCIKVGIGPIFQTG